MRKVLIVDDEPHVGLVMKQFLFRSGYKVETALNGEQALAAIREDSPDIVVTDVQMPKMGGIELCETILTETPDLGRLIILMTSRTDKDIRDRADRLESVELMEKPLSLRGLVVRLNAHFNHLQEASEL